MSRSLAFTATVAFLCAATSRDAAAEANGKTFSIAVASTVSGAFGGELTFVDDGTFVLKPEDGNKGTGTYTETVDPLTLNSTFTGTGNDGEDYQGVVTGSTTEMVLGGTQPLTIVAGIGIGNARDLFVFVGVYVAPVEPPAERTPAERPRERTPRRRR